MQVPYEGVKATFLGFGYPEWQVDGILELNKLQDLDNYVYGRGDLVKILGREPTTIQQWTAQVKGAFA